ncbi:penicillin-binding protein [Lysinibacillus contaminans]|uniref:serine-type D-Ala-D-Ala carboxypeptidase n=1 Tax=Lysinibacillus contaminans TaxID=1293441 RepID=A0ABR5K0T6_9BACI|nr:penicillin-binding protein [Lysinibacillus contaminans]
MSKRVLSQRNSKEKAKQQTTLPLRMNILFLLIFILFALLIFRLGYIQIVQGDYYVGEVKSTEEIQVNTSVPRGRIYDRYGRVLIDNQPENAITYTRMPKIKNNEILTIAEQLAKLIDMPIDRVTYRDKQDFWVLKNNKAAMKKVKTEEMDEFRLTKENMSEKEVDKEYNRRILKRITEEELAQLSPQDLEVLAIYREMTSGYLLSPQIIKSENVTDKEFALVSERLSELSGVNTTTDWKRVRHVPLSILGRTTTPSKGIPKSKLDYYLARDYSRNDRVGESFFEAQYEDILQGEKSVMKNITDRSGTVVETLMTDEGEPGKDLVTTLDIELQQEAERIVEDALLKMKSSGDGSLLDRAFYIMMNPNTGEILSMVGKKVEYDEAGKMYLADYSYGTFTTAYEMGSTVKGATVLTGYREGAISIGTKQIDEPIVLGRGLVKKSIFNHGSRIWMDDLMALEQSSNVYMFKTALSMGGLTYYPNMATASLLKDDTLQRLRNGYAQLGLGVPTGIDLPGETTGVINKPDSPGKVLDITIGQFDTYTPLQLAQYVSTIANNGYRVQPRFLKQIRKPSEDGVTLGPLISEIEPEILNQIDNTQAEINRVKEGFRRVYYGARGSARYNFSDTPYTAAGKTGTAEVVYFGPQENRYHTNTINLVHVGFAPFDKPEVAYAVVIPWASTNLNPSTYYNNTIARQVLDKYFELQNKHQAEGLTDSLVDQKIIRQTDAEILKEDQEKSSIIE